MPCRKYTRLYGSELTEDARCLLAAAAGWGFADDYTNAAVLPVARPFPALLSTASVLLAVERTAYVAPVVFGLDTFQVGEAVAVAVLCVVAGWRRHQREKRRYAGSVNIFSTHGTVMSNQSGRRCPEFDQYIDMISWLNGSTFSPRSRSHKPGSRGSAQATSPPKVVRTFSATRKAMHVDFQCSESRWEEANPPSCTKSKASSSFSPPLSFHRDFILDRISFCEGNFASKKAWTHNKAPNATKTPFDRLPTRAPTEEHGIILAQICLLSCGIYCIAGLKTKSHLRVPGAASSSEESGAANGRGAGAVGAAPSERGPGDEQHLKMRQKSSAEELAAWGLRQKQATKEPSMATIFYFFFIFHEKGTVGWLETSTSWSSLSRFTFATRNGRCAWNMSADSSAPKTHASTPPLSPLPVVQNNGTGRAKKSSRDFRPSSSRGLALVRDPPHNDWSCSSIAALVPLGSEKPPLQSLVLVLLLLLLGDCFLASTV